MSARCTYLDATKATSSQITTWEWLGDFQVPAADYVWCEFSALSKQFVAGRGYVNVHVIRRSTKQLVYAGTSTTAVGTPVAGAWLNGHLSGQQDGKVTPADWYDVYSWYSAGEIALNPQVTIHVWLNGCSDSEPPYALPAPTVQAVGPGTAILTCQASPLARAYLWYVDGAYYGVTTGTSAYFQGLRAGAHKVTVTPQNLWGSAPASAPATVTIGSGSPSPPPPPSSSSSLPLLLVGAAGIGGVILVTKARQRKPLPANPDAVGQARRRGRAAATR